MFRVRQVGICIFHAVSYRVLPCLTSALAPPQDRRARMLHLNGVPSVPVIVRQRLSSPTFTPTSRVMDMGHAADALKRKRVRERLEQKQSTGASDASEASDASSAPVAPEAPGASGAPTWEQVRAEGLTRSWADNFRRNGPDYCVVCGDGGELVECDTCSMSFCIGTDCCDYDHPGNGWVCDACLHKRQRR